MNLIFCLKTNCKYYYEDNCLKKSTTIGIDGKCESFTTGLNNLYKPCTTCLNYLTTICCKSNKGEQGELCKNYNGDIQEV